MTAALSLLARGDGLGTTDSGLIGERDDSMAQLLSPDGRVVVALGAVRAPALDGADLRRASRGPVMLERHLPGFDDAARMIAQPARDRGVPRIVVVGESLVDRNEALRALVRSFAVAGFLGGPDRVGDRLRTGHGGAQAGREHAPARVGDLDDRRVGAAPAGAGTRRDPPAGGDAQRDARPAAAILRARAALRRRRQPRAPLADRGHQDRARGRPADRRARAGRARERSPPRSRSATGSRSWPRTSWSLRAPRRPPARAPRAAAGARALLEGARAPVRRPRGGTRPGDPRRRARRSSASWATRCGCARRSATWSTTRSATAPATSRSRARPTADGVEIDVSDQGAGFGADIAERAFERFTRASESRSGEGAGLGLAIVRAIADAHGGRAEIVETPSGGTVRLLLPAVETDRPAPAPAPADAEGSPVSRPSHLTASRVARIVSRRGSNEGIARRARTPPRRRGSRRRPALLAALVLAAVSAVVLTGCGDSTARAGATTPPGRPAAGRRDGPPRPGDFTTAIDNPYMPVAAGERVGLLRTSTRAARRNACHPGPAADEGDRRRPGARRPRHRAARGSELIEDTFDWFAQDRQGNVWYLGEATQAYSNGTRSSTRGPGRPGSAARSPGVVMPAHPRAGAAVPPGIPQGRGRGPRARAERRRAGPGAVRPLRPARVLTKEFSRLEPDDLEYKLYGKGVGLVRAARGLGGCLSVEALVSYRKGGG